MDFLICIYALAVFDILAVCAFYFVFIKPKSEARPRSFRQACQNSMPYRRKRK